VTLSNCYPTLDEFKAYLFPAGNAGASEDPEMEAAITAACRSVDVYCARRFYVDTSTSARYYPTPGWRDIVPVDDFSTTTGLTVKADTNDNGTYDQTWTINTDFIVEPVNSEADGITGLPYTTIRPLRTLSWPTRGDRPYPIEVTAKWGWAAVPSAVKQASLIKAARVYRRAKTPDGFAAGESFGAIRVSNREDPDVAMLLGPYRKFGGAGLVVA
jgi:hypothetical protein